MRAISATVLLIVLAACQTRDERPPNFVILLCDNLGYGDTEPFGGRLHRTPHLNRMASEGRTLRHFYASAGVCTPSRASLMTGSYAQRVGLHTNPRDGLVLRPVSPFGLNPEETTVAEVLKDRGYATAVIGKWHLGDQPAFLPARHGFDSFFGIPYSDDMTQVQGRGREQFDGDRWPPLPLMEDGTVVEAPADRNLLTRRYTDRAMEYIEENAERPFFLYLAHAMPGSTRAPFASEQFRGRSSNGPWGDSVEELDWSTGEILDKLVDLDLAERTLVLWTSDNGAPLARDLADPSRGSNLPLHGRGYSTAEGGFRIPAIAWWPGTIAGGTETDELMSLIDILPTFAALASTAPDPERRIDGVDVGDALLGRGGARSPRDRLYYYQQDELHAVRFENWKLFLPLEAPDSRHPHFGQWPPDQPLLFDLAADPASRTDLAASRPEVVQRLLEIADEARDDLGDRNARGSGQRSAGRIENPTPRVLVE